MRTSVLVGLGVLIPLLVFSRVAAGQTASWADAKRTAIGRLRSDFGATKTKALCAYIDAMRPIPAGTMDGTKVEAFVLGATPVTWAVWEEYQAIHGGTKHHRRPRFARLDHPVVNISLKECKQFCLFLSKITRVTFALPTETEFEYAERDGGKVGKLPWGKVFDDTKLWCSVVHKRHGTASVNRRSNIFVNSLGLSDMMGNVLQMVCQDRTSSGLLYTGFSWNDSDLSRLRYDLVTLTFDENYRDPYIGFRLYSTLSQ